MNAKTGIRSLAGWVLGALIAAALLLGIHARFVGLGVWPLATDEYYIARSILRILDTAVPEFVCGGYYVRGLFYQYVTATLAATGVPVDLSARIVAACSAVLMLPAVFLIARRLGGKSVAIIAVLTVVLSLWQIEMARFGRMYAPFQAIFLWYAYFTLRAVLDGDARARIWLLLLSVLGLLTWEGGVLLLAANLVPLAWDAADRKHTGRDIVYAVAAVAIAIVGFGYGLADLRISEAANLFPEGYAPGDYRPRAVGPRFVLLTDLLNDGWGWRLPALALAVLAATAVFRMARATELSGYERLAWCVALLSLLIHQFIAAVAVVLLAVLFGWIPLDRLRTRLPVLLTVAALGAVIFWAAFAFASDASAMAAAGASLPQAARRFAAVVLKYPNYYGRVISPLLRAMPVQSILVAGLSSVVLVAILARRFDSPDRSGARLLLALIALLLSMLGAIGSSFSESRYVFFLYPLLLIAAWLGLKWLIDHAGLARSATAALVVSGLAWFVISDDFNLRHTLRAHTAEYNFRLPHTPARAAHYYARYDFRSAAHYVNENRSEGDIVITTVPVVEYYLSGSALIYLDAADGRFAGMSCDRGRIERWSGRPLLYSSEQVRAAVEAAPAAAWIVVGRKSRLWNRWEMRLFERHAGQAVYTTPDGSIDVLRIPSTRVAPGE